MPAKLLQNKIYVSKSSIHGRGVFAEKDIDRDEIVEECHTLITEGKDFILREYYFKVDNNQGIPLGFGCIYNHSDNNNLHYFYDPDRQIMVFQATQFIPKGSELFISYGKHWFSSRDLVPLQYTWRYWLKKIVLPPQSIFMRAFIVCVGLFSAVKLLKYLLAP